MTIALHESVRSRRGVGEVPAKPHLSVTIHGAEAMTPVCMWSEVESCIAHHESCAANF